MPLAVAASVPSERPGAIRRSGTTASGMDGHVDDLHVACLIGCPKTTK
jgi:hypothetical protein